MRGSILLPRRDSIRQGQFQVTFYIRHQPRSWFLAYKVWIRDKGTLGTLHIWRLGFCMHAMRGSNFFERGWILDP